MLTKKFSEILCIMDSNGRMPNNMAGNVDRGNRKVMQIESSRELPNMIYGIRQNHVNRQVSFLRIVFFHSITALYIQNGEYNSISIYVCIRNE